MIELKKDILSLSDFKRNTARHMSRLKKSGSPLVLTVNGKARVVVQDAEAYQVLLQASSRIEMLEFLARSEADIKAGRAVPALEFLKNLGKEQ